MVTATYPVNKMGTDTVVKVSLRIHCGNCHKYMGKLKEMPITCTSCGAVNEKWH